jgi:hypothetical protein
MVFAVVAFHAVVYLLSVLYEFRHPYWIDNNIEVFVPVADRWKSAVGPGAGLIELLLLPFFLVGLWMWNRVSKRGNGQSK